MKQVIINENQRGFLFQNGRYIKTLGPGKYCLIHSFEVEISSFGTIINPSRCTLDTLLADPAFAKQVSVTEVSDEQIVLHYVNGRFAGAICVHGKYAFWNGSDTHEFRTIDITTPEVSENIPKYIFGMIPANHYIKLEVEEYEKGSLFYDNKFVRILDPGVYYFWKNSTKISFKTVDTRLTQMNITGQEIMTQDKVSLRINFVCSYRIRDYVKILSEIDSFEEEIHVAVQLALRDYVGKYKLDEILENKDEMSRCVLENLKKRESEFYVEIKSAGVRDIILPGEIRDIMNTVIAAEKKAQANVITRREEVASTRSLLNTAKMMEENQMLRRLKELEYIERISENVGNINLNSNGDMLSQLLTILGSH